MLVNKGGYIYIAPDFRLSQYISNYTIAFPSICPKAEKFSIIPDASSSIVVEFDGVDFNTKMWGAMTKVNKMGTKANHFKLILMIEFQPGGLHRFTGINQSEITDQKIPLYDINKNLEKKIVEELEKSENIDILMERLDRLFLLLIDRIDEASELSQMISLAVGNCGLISVKEISETVYYSSRHINRLCAERLGMSMKVFLRLIRINNVVRMLKKSNFDFLDVAFQCGFCDQSHFIKEFKLMLGMTPQEYIHSMSDFYNEDFKL